MKVEKCWHHLFYADLISFFVTRKCKKNRKIDKTSEYWKKKSLYYQLLQEFQWNFQERCDIFCKTTGGIKLTPRPFRVKKRNNKYSNFHLFKTNKYSQMVKDLPKDFQLFFPEIHLYSYLWSKMANVSQFLHCRWNYQW